MEFFAIDIIHALFGLPTGKVVFIIVVVVMALFQFFWIFNFLSRTLFVKKQLNQSKQPVSIIIAARNEAIRLESLLPVLLQQNYPDFEIIVADDRSVDGTGLLVKRMASSDNRLRYIRIEDTPDAIHGKKHALTRGINEAKNEWLLFLDADCVPVSDLWIQSMANAMLPDKDIVLAYSGFFAEKSAVNALIRYDAAIIAMQYLGMASAGIPYMGVGRNLMYRKNIWERHAGFESHAHLSSGDDDLFVMQAANATNTAVAFHAEAITRSQAKTGFQLWRNQKLRHLSTSRKYSPHIAALLLVEPLTRVLFLIFTLTGFFVLPVSIALLLAILWFLRAGLLAIIQVKFLKKAGEDNFGLMALVFDVILPFVYLYFFSYQILTKQKPNWK